jgi:hypothetical protein
MVTDHFSPAPTPDITAVAKRVALAEMALRLSPPQHAHAPLPAHRPRGPVARTDGRNVLRLAENPATEASILESKMRSSPWLLWSSPLRRCSSRAQRLLRRRGLDLGEAGVGQSA